MRFLATAKSKIKFRDAQAAIFSGLAHCPGWGPYLKRILSVIGVTDATFVQAGSTWKVDRGMTDRAIYLARVSAQLALLAGV